MEKVEKIVWNSSFSVGVATLDLQHKRIIEMINRLISSEDLSVSSETVSDLLTKLREYADAHFRAEEEVLAEHGYPDLATQKAEHLEYRRKYVTFCRDTMAKNDAVPEALLAFLKQWWTEHVLVSDMEYRAFLEERGVR